MSDFKNKAKSFMIGAALVPAAGLLAHMGGAIHPYAESEDYSLKHRYECAYSFNTPEEHKHYTVTSWDTPEFDGIPDQKKSYLASPWAMYPAMLGLGLLGARRRWYDKIQEKCR